MISDYLKFLLGYLKSPINSEISCISTIEFLRNKKKDKKSNKEAVKK